MRFVIIGVAIIISVLANGCVEADATSSISASFTAPAMTLSPCASVQLTVPGAFLTGDEDVDRTTIPAAAWLPIAGAPSLVDGKWILANSGSHVFIAPLIASAGTIIQKIRFAYDGASRDHFEFGLGVTDLATGLSSVLPTLGEDSTSFTWATTDITNVCVSQPFPNSPCEGPLTIDAGKAYWVQVRSQHNGQPSSFGGAILNP